MQTWRTKLALAAGIALVAGGCGTAEPTLAAPQSARRDVAPQQVSPPPADTGRDERWGGFIGGGG